MPISKQDFISLMHYPKEWLTLGMYPDELFLGQLAIYHPGDECGAEHDRNGAFHWWLKRNPTKEQLKLLIKLTTLDPDKTMAADVRWHILQSANADAEIIRLIGEISNDNQ